MSLSPDGSGSGLHPRARAKVNAHCWNPLRVDYFTQPRESLTVTHYASGSSAVGDLRGFSRILYPLGVTISDIGAPALQELLGLGHLPLPVFVDSGAFSEEEDAPIATAEWVRRLGIARAIASALGPNAMIVAPDRVGDQGETLTRLASHADAVRALRTLGAKVVVPVQCGAMRPEAFDAAATRALGFDDFVRGIPGNKAAMSTREVKGLVRAVRSKAVHLLGIGPHGLRFGELVGAIRDAVPDAAISCDSNLLAAHVGKANGPGGGPRAVTDAERLEVEVTGERSRENAIVQAFGPAAMWRRAVLAGMLGPAGRYRDLGVVYRVQGAPVVLASFGEEPKPPARQLGLFGDDD